MTIREKVYDIIFEHDTKAGKAFDIGLILVILISVIAVMLDTIESLDAEYGNFFYGLEWFFTILFTLEYILRLWVIEQPWQYAKSFYGIVDVLSFLPTYLSLFIPGSQFFLAIRILRVLRIFRILKLVQYIEEANLLTLALQNSAKKIFVFLFTVLSLVVIFGSLMYLIEEGSGSGFTSIPKSIYWAIVTLTTVGYGDISPDTPLGQMLAACIMILGYCIIAVPTGIVTTAMARQKKRGTSGKVCPSCSAEGHDKKALFCLHCGHELANSPSST